MSSDGKSIGMTYPNQLEEKFVILDALRSELGSTFVARFKSDYEMLKANGYIDSDSDVSGKSGK